jgi:hypothetical protein
MASAFTNLLSALLLLLPQQDAHCIAKKSRAAQACT